MMNKKGQVFEMGLVLVIFTICVFAIVSFLIYNHKTSGSFDISPIISLYNQQEDISFYAEEAGKLSAQEAYSNTLKGVGKDCRKYSDYAVWTHDCIMKIDAFRDEFMLNFNSSIDRLMIDKKTSIDSVSSNENIISVSFQPLILNASMKSISNIDVNYTVNPSFSINISDYGIDLNFWKVSNQVLSQWDECKRKSNDAITIKNCMNRMTSDDWQFMVISTGEFFCSLTSKQEYYFNDKLQPIIIKFKLEKIIAA